MAPKRGSILHIGIAGYVVAIDTATGAEVWRTKLKSSSFTTVMVDGKRVYAGTQGELFCLDAVTGDVLWSNALKGLRQGIVCFGSEGGAVTAAVAAAAAAAAAAAG